MGRHNSAGWRKRVGTGVGPPPSFWDRHAEYIVAIALVTAVIAFGLVILQQLEPA